MSDADKIDWQLARDKLLASQNMSQRHFRDQYLCYPKRSPKDMLTEELAARYHAETEAYDRSVCTGPTGRDGIMPACHSQYVLVNRNAIKVRRQIMDQAKREGISGSEMQRAISRFVPRPTHGEHV